MLKQRVIEIVFMLTCIFKLSLTVEGNVHFADEVERVVNGADAPQNRFPWTAALYYRNSFVCTASIISKRHILTAAHCVVFNEVLELPESYFAIIGSINKAIGNGKRVEFSKIAPNPSYTTLVHDIAVMTTSEDIVFDDSIQPICVATQKLGTLTLSSVTAMGWGITSRNTSVTRTPDTLQYTKLSVYPNIKCDILYFNDVPDTILCAGNLNTGICSGDSGGPLVYYQGYFDRKPVEVGVASFVNSLFGCGKLLGPAGFTNVAYYTDFLQKETQGMACFV